MLVIAIVVSFDFVVFVVVFLINVVCDFVKVVVGIFYHWLLLIVVVVGNSCSCC